MTMSRSVPIRIFLAHRKPDAPIVREFLRALPEFITTWIDEKSLCWGDSLSNEIKATISDDVDFLIVFLRADTLQSPWVKQELGWALEREASLGRKFILPIVLEQANLPPEFENGDRLYLRLLDYSGTSVRNHGLRIDFGVV